MRIKRLIVTVFCLINLLISMATTAKANGITGLDVEKENQSETAQPLKLVVGVEDLSYYPLFDFKSEHDTFTTELLREFGNQYNYQFEYMPMPVKRFGMWLFEQDIDLKFPDNSRWNESDEVNLLAKQITYSSPVIELVAGTITANPNLKTKQEIKVMGTLLGFHPTKWLNEVRSGEVELYESSSTMMLLQQLLRGHLDAVNLEPSVVQYYLSIINKENSIAINRHFDFEVYSYHLSTVKHPSVIADFNEFLKGNAELLKSLKSKYKIIDPTPFRTP